MGLCGSSEADSPSGAKSGNSPASNSSHESKVASAAAPEKKLDPKDFMLQKLQDQTIVREPGCYWVQCWLLC